MNVFNEWLYKQWRDNKDSMVGALQKLMGKEMRQLDRSIYIKLIIGLEDWEEENWNDQITCDIWADSWIGLLMKSSNEF